jgi:hypothetical protein
MLLLLPPLLLLTPLLAEPVLAVYLATTDFPSSVRKSAPTATVAVAAMKNKTARRSACCRWRVRSVEARQAASSFRGWPLGWLCRLAEPLLPPALCVLLLALALVLVVLALVLEVVVAFVLLVLVLLALVLLALLDLPPLPLVA